MEANQKPASFQQRKALKAYGPFALGFALLFIVAVLFGLSLSFRSEKESTPFSHQNTEEKILKVAVETHPALLTGRHPDEGDELQPLQNRQSEQQLWKNETIGEGGEPSDKKGNTDLSGRADRGLVVSGAPEWLPYNPNSSYPMEAKRSPREYKGSAPVAKMQYRLPEYAILSNTQERDQGADTATSELDKEDTEEEDAILETSEEAQQEFHQNEQFITEAIETLPLTSIQAYDPINRDNPGPEKGEVWIRIQPEFSKESKEIMAQVADHYHDVTRDVDPVTVILLVGGSPVTRSTFSYDE